MEWSLNPVFPHFVSRAMNVTAFLVIEKYGEKMISVEDRRWKRERSKSLDKNRLSSFFWLARW